jgi:hypothetical protein
MRRIQAVRAPILAAILAVIALAAVFAVPAFGNGPVLGHAARESAFQRATRALRVARLANSRASLALSIARSRHPGTGPAGPRGLTGARGRTGATGHTGATGPAGPAGLSAASFASFADGGVPPLGASGSPGTPNTVISLSSGTNGGPLKLGATAIVLANASVLLRSTEPSATGEARCKLQIADPSGYVDMSQESAATIPPVTGEVELPLVGTLSRSAGTYDVRVVCRQVGSTLLHFDRGNLQVSAAA